jgi:hypothetical protein
MGLIRKLQSMNEACLMKLGWSLMTGEQNLWGDVLLGKYGRGGWSLGDKVEYLSLLMTPHFGRL